MLVSHLQMVKTTNFRLEFEQNISISEHGFRCWLAPVIANVDNPFTMIGFSESDRVSSIMASTCLFTWRTAIACCVLPITNCFATGMVLSRLSFARWSPPVPLRGPTSPCWGGERVLDRPLPRCQNPFADLAGLREMFDFAGFSRIRHPASRREA